MLSARKLDTGFVQTSSEVVRPKEVCRIPPAAPATHISTPFVLTAARGLVALAKSVNRVVTSTLPLPSTRPMTRETLLVLESATEPLVYVAFVPYPTKTR